MLDTFIQREMPKIPINTLATEFLKFEQSTAIFLKLLRMLLLKIMYIGNSLWSIIHFIQKEYLQTCRPSFPGFDLKKRLTSLLYENWAFLIRIRRFLVKCLLAAYNLSFSSLQISFLSMANVC